MTRKEYIKQQASECECGVRKYEKDMKYNFVIYYNNCGALGFIHDSNIPKYGNVPIVFGGLADLMNDIWDDDEIVMTEEYYVNNLMDLEKMPYYLDSDLVEKEYNGKKYRHLKAEAEYWEEVTQEQKKIILVFLGALEIFSYLCTGFPKDKGTATL